MYNVYCDNKLVAEKISEKSMLFLVNHYDMLKKAIKRSYNIKVVQV
jgi:hypothetical protein